jgi:hypothetical protein
MGVNAEREPAKISGAIRVTLPISVACDLDKFQRALANIAQLVGCAGRTPGVGAPFVEAREYVVDPASLQARESGRQ